MSQLHEYCRAYGFADPEEVDLSPKVQKMDHKPEYRFAFKIGKVQYTMAKGRNKKMAKEKAAELALNEIREGRIPKVVNANTESPFDRYY